MTSLGTARSSLLVLGILAAICSPTVHFYLTVLMVRANIVSITTIGGVIGCTVGVTVTVTGITFAVTTSNGSRAVIYTKASSER